MKTIPELEEEIKPIEDKITVIGNAISVRRHYNLVDISFIISQKQEIENDLLGLNNAITEIANYTKKILEKSNIDIETWESSVRILQRLWQLSNEMVRLENLVNGHLETFQEHN